MKQFRIFLFMLTQKEPVAFQNDFRKSININLILSMIPPNWTLTEYKRQLRGIISFSTDLWEWIKRIQSYILISAKPLSSSCNVEKSWVLLKYDWAKWNSNKAWTSTTRFGLRMLNRSKKGLFGGKFPTKDSLVKKTTSQNQRGNNLPGCQYFRYNSYSRKRSSGNGHMNSRIELSRESIWWKMPLMVNDFQNVQHLYLLTEKRRRGPCGLLARLERIWNTIGKAWNIPQETMMEASVATSALESHCWNQHLGFSTITILENIQRSLLRLWFNVGLSLIVLMHHDLCWSQQFYQMLWIQCQESWRNQELPCFMNIIKHISCKIESCPMR